MNNKHNTIAPFLVFATILLASLACSTAATPTPEPTPTLQPTPQNYKVGDIVTIDDYSLVVVGWENPGDNFKFKPKMGNKLVIVEVLIENKRQSNISISAIIQMSLKDDTGQEYKVDNYVSAFLGDKKISNSGDLASGEIVQGKVGFQIPENAKGLQFVFDNSMFGLGKVLVDLGPAPIKVEVPSKLTSKTDQQIYKVGDAINVGGLIITVNNVTSLREGFIDRLGVGDKYLVINLTIENKGADIINVSPLLQMWVKNAGGQGKKYELDSKMQIASTSRFPDGDIATGRTVSGEVWFEVPENTDGLVFVFYADLSGVNKAFVALP